MLIVLLLSVLEQGSAVALYSMGTLARSAHDWVGVVLVILLKLTLMLDSEGTLSGRTLSHPRLN